MTWKYNAVLNTGLTVLLTVAAGVVVGRLRLLPRGAHAVVNATVFKVFLPALICRGIGIKTDLYDDGIWRFIGAFLLLRLAALAVACASNAARAWTDPKGKRDGSALPGRVAVDWLGLSWISTVILGVPVLKAAMGDKFAKFGILAGISSFVFQLPVMLVLLEVHRWITMSLPSTQQDATCAAARATTTTAYTRALKPDLEAPSGNVTEDSTLTTGTCARPLPPLPELPPIADPSSITSTAGSSTCGSAAPPTNGDTAHPDARAVGSVTTESVTLNSYVPPPPISGRVGCAPAGDARLCGSLMRLLGSLLTNHVLWGITIGFVLSLSKVGPKRLDPGKGTVVVGGKAIYLPNPDFVEELGFIDQTLEWLGRCTTPAALFAMGLWIPSQWAAFWAAAGAVAPRDADAPKPTQPYARTATLRDGLLHWLKVLWMLVFKLMLCPLLMVALAKALNLEDGPARAATLVAAIPISLASFTLAETFGMGEALLAKLVVLGTLLMLPATVLWLEALDNTDTFLLPQPGA